MKKLVKLLKNWRICFPILFVYLETVFHLYMNLSMKYAPVFLILAFAAGMICSGILFFIAEQHARIIGFVIITAASLMFTVECICKDILQQYYQIFSGAETAAGNKLTDYASTVAGSILDNKTGIFLMLIISLG